MEAETELKPCPFCGGEANIWLRHMNKRFEIKIKCGSCTATVTQCFIRLRGDVDQYKNMTAQNWNRMKT
jgi:transcription elongation factor Elf1